MSVQTVGAEGEFLNDLWRFDVTSSGWEPVEFSKTTIANCPAAADVSINPSIPDVRASHVMVGMGPTSLLCGGYKVENKAEFKWSKDALGSMDCWWLTPLPEPRWDVLKLKAGTKLLPPPRHSAIMLHDNTVVDDGGRRGRAGIITESLIVIGGQGEGEKLLGDCWYLTVESGNARSFSKEYEWNNCNVAAGQLAMTPRYGHNGLIFRGHIYVHGGFASDGRGGSSAKKDLWELINYDQPTRYWEEVMPSSESPSARAFHAVWLAGSKLILHGGQSSGGAGIASVVSDTWSFDLFSYVWTLYGSSSDLPVTSHMHTASSTSSISIAFGGLTSSGTSSGKLYTFDSQLGWSRGHPSLFRV